METREIKMIARRERQRGIKNRNDTEKGRKKQRETHVQQEESPLSGVRVVGVRVVGVRVRVRVTVRVESDERHENKSKEAIAILMRLRTSLFQPAWQSNPEKITFIASPLTFF